MLVCVVGELHAKFVWLGSCRRLSNFARNSPATCLDIEVVSLELQRFRVISKNDRRKLCATFSGVVIAVTLGCCGQAPPPPTGTTARPYLHPVCVTPLIPRSTTNFACNSLTTISNIEFTALELQRFWTLLKVHAIELHAELMEPGPATAASFESGTLRRCSRF